MGDVERVREKLEEYGIEIYSDYSISKNEYVFMVEKMAIFINTKEHKIGLSFHAETRPDNAATFTLIIKEIKDMKEIDIMESFVVDAGNTFVSGDKAFDLVQKNIIKNVTSEIIKEHTYAEMLMNEKCYKC